MTEILDIYDENMKHVGTKARPDVHRDGDWHRVFHCWVIYRDVHGDDWVIIQKRSPAKLSFPNMLDVSAAGHYEAGETAREGMRELEEELGLSPQFEDLVYVGKRITFSGYGGAIDREVADVFFYVCDQPLQTYCYQEEEVAGLIAVKTSDALRLFSGDVDCLEVPACGFENDTVMINRTHFITVMDHYWEKIFLLASRCLNDETQLWV